MSGLIAPSGAPGVILEAVRSHRIEAIMSWQLVDEVIEVLSRPKIRRYGISHADVDEVIELPRPMLPRLELELEVRDPDDVAVVVAAVAGRAQVIVTGDRDVLDDDATRTWLLAQGNEILTAAQLAERLST